MTDETKFQLTHAVSIISHCTDMMQHQEAIYFWLTLSTAIDVLDVCLKKHNNPVLVGNLKLGSHWELHYARNVIE